MGFERVAGIIATTKNFTDFTQLASNYNSDLFTDIFTHTDNIWTEVEGSPSSIRWNVGFVGFNHLF